MTDDDRRELAAQVREFWMRMPQPELGQAIKLLRAQFDTKRSFLDHLQEASGEDVGAGDSLVFRWERGEVTPGGRYRQMFDRLCKAQLEVMSTKTRREFLRQLALLSGGWITLPHALTAGDDLNAAAATLPGREPAFGPGQRVGGDGLPNHPTSELEPLAVALMSPPREDLSAPLSGHAVEAWKLRQQAQYRRLAEYLPRALMQGRATELESTREPSRSDLAELIHLYNAACSLAKSLGSYDLARIAAERAVQTASITGDPLLRGAAIYRHANVLLSAGELASAQSVAISAADGLRPMMTATRTHTALWSGLLGTAALAAARRHHPAEAWELLGESKVAADMLMTEQADLFTIFGPASWLTHAVNVAADLGDGSEAVRRAERVRADRLPQLLSERRTFLLVGQARGYALCRNEASAATTLLEAAHEAPEEVHHNPEAHLLIYHLVSRDRGQNGPLRELVSRMTGVPGNDMSPGVGQ